MLSEDVLKLLGSSCNGHLIYTHGRVYLQDSLGYLRSLKNLVKDMEDLRRIGKYPYRFQQIDKKCGRAYDVNVTIEGVTIRNMISSEDSINHELSEKIRRVI